MHVRADSDLEQERPLDNPIWACLCDRHAHLALGDALARRYRPEISPLAGLAGDSPHAAASLAAIVRVGDEVGIFGPVPALGPAWEGLDPASVTQMIRRDESPLDEGNVDAVTLDVKDVPEMLDLVELTQPGPFRPRTIELGTYIGIRDRGRLVAMAGERMWIDGYREVSAICTHPDVRGRGYARALMSRVVNRMVRAGQVPFLHVFSANRQAIGLYHSVGFDCRAEFSLHRLRRLSES